MPDTVLWFRRDLRLADHPALLRAHEQADGGRVLPLFVVDPALVRPSGPVRLAWLARSLESLDGDVGGALVVRTGDPATVVAVAAELGAAGVHVSADAGPYGRRRDEAVERALGDVPLVRTGSPYAVGRAGTKAFDAWCAGSTGFPFVDAGMRQLHREGWMHNRVRWLRDGDLASNNHGWQWVAGTGTDAAPYFRVFNPVTQGQKLDPDGDYVRRYVPELAHLPGRAAHTPWDVDGGYAQGYPPRIVDHAAERAEALARYSEVRS